ncbi:hypothetical protein D3C75_1309950 [compost metagenome]
MRHEVILLRLHQQHVTGKLGAGAQCPVVPRAEGALTVVGQALTVERLLGQVPFIVPVQRRHP